MPLKVGDVAPDFAVMNQDKKVVKLSELRGKRVVLLFYPLDFSPICTAEHCEFSPNLGKFAGANTVVFGVSCDSPFAHEAYKKQFNIGYDLLADVNRTLVKAYALYWADGPFNCGKRGTVVIDEAGKIAHWHEQPVGEGRKVEALVAAAK